MPITFNGSVTVNGNMEVYSDGRMKISDNTINVHIDQLKDYMRQTLPYSANLPIYEEAASEIQKSSDKNVIKTSMLKLKDFFYESGKAFWITGLSTVAQEVAKEISKRS